MDDSQIAAALKDNAQTGGRPTWQQSTNGASARAGGRTRGTRPRTGDPRFADPLNLFARAARTRGQKPMTERELKMVELDRQAFEVMGFDHRASADELKKAYKELVKIHHPDANGGDRASEDRFRAIVAAYQHLKSKGFLG